MLEIFLYSLIGSKKQPFSGSFKKACIINVFSIGIGLVKCLLLNLCTFSKKD